MACNITGIVTQQIITCNVGTCIDTGSGVSALEILNGGNSAATSKTVLDGGDPSSTGKTELDGGDSTKYNNII